MTMAAVETGPTTLHVRTDAAASLCEAYVDGHWHTFDPRNNVPRIGRVLIARGRDAADVAIATTFGMAFLESFTVITDEVNEQVPVGMGSGGSPS